MKPILSVQEMAWVDRQTLRRRQLSSWQLMNEVADQMAEHLMARFPKRSTFLFLCGPGNNGGDAYCVAERLRIKHQVWVQPVFPPASEECKRAARRCRAPRWTGGKVPEVLVDGIFGIGQRSGIDRSLQRLLKSIRSQYQVALDIPTRGFIANLTLMVAYPKQILLYEETAAECGEIEWVGRQFVTPRFWNEEFLEDSDFKSSPLKPSAFKRGRVGVMAGGSSTPGAGFLAAEAAARMQVGYVHLFYPSIKHFKLSLERAGFLYQFGKPSASLLHSMQAWVLGPGGVQPSLLKKIAKQKVPTVIDAEALQYQKWFRRSPQVVCTPHPGEAGRMLGVSTSQIQADRLDSVRALVEQTGQSVYLKGAPGLFMQPGEKVVLNYSLQPVMARAGSGDVLAGVLGGMLARSPAHSTQACFNSLIFQRRIAQKLSELPAAIASDQLRVFSDVWRSLEC